MSNWDLKTSLWTTNSWSFILVWLFGKSLRNRNCKIMTSCCYVSVFCCDFLPQSFISLVYCLSFCSSDLACYHWCISKCLRKLSWSWKLPWLIIERLMKFHQRVQCSYRFWQSLWFPIYGSFEHVIYRLAVVVCPQTFML